MKCEVGREWTWTKVGRICKTNVSSYSPSERWPFVNYLETKGIMGGRISEIQHIILAKQRLPSRARRKVSKNDIVYSTVRPNQRHYGIIKEPLPNMLVSTGFSVLTVDTAQCDATFLYYWLSQNRIVETLQALAEQSVSTYPTIRDADLEALEILLPPLSVQKRIAAILSALDDKIELNNKISANLEQQAQALFKAWFVDNPDISSWQEATFANLVERAIGGDWGKDLPSGNNTEMVYCIRGADIPEVRAGNKGKMPTRYILPKNYAAKKLMDGDIVVEISGGSPTQSTGRAAVVSAALLSRYDKGMVCSNFCKALKPIAGFSMYMYYYWQHLYEMGMFFSYENGTTGIKNLDIKGFLETEPISIAPVELVRRFDCFVQSLLSEVYANGLENEQLALTRDTLLPYLMPSKDFPEPLGE